MSDFALLLVLSAAFAHATWNYLAKKACGGTAFGWLFGAISTVVYFPLAIGILLYQQPVIGLNQLIFMAGTAVLHCAYFYLLDRGYRIGDLSLIYPLARSTGPLLAMITAVLFLGEKPTLVTITGGLMILAGVFFLTGNPLLLKKADARKPALFAILCGIVIASYTVWDKMAVSLYLVPPLLLDWSANLGRTLLLTPYAVQNRSKVYEQWKTNKKLAFGVGILCPLAYILVLTALVFSPVSYIAPAREISILVGTVLGAKLLSEGNLKSRMAAAGSMVIGLAVLSLG
ncbi:MAG: protein of unknown function transrane [Firmicutes bacterium]|nr:protein of unknown function transrane [Bacillota bacterium]